MSEAPSFSCFQRNPSVTISDTNRHLIQSEPPGFDQVRPRSKKRQLELAPPTPPTKLPRYPTQDSNPRNERQHVVAISSRYQEKTIENGSYEYEENIKQVLVSEYPKRDGEVIGITGNKQVYKFGQTRQEAESIHKQPAESSSPRQQSWSNTLILHDVISHIEQVSSQVEALRNEMDMKMEEIKQMIDDRTLKTNKGGFKLPGFKIKNGKK